MHHYLPSFKTMSVKR